jgi:phytoene dehydrogenase-like protein
MAKYDAVVVGSGPNGLAAAITMASAGLRVVVLEGSSTPGGGCRTEDSTVPGFRHDVCSTVYPLLALSPFFQQEAFVGLRAATLQPEVPFAHPLDRGNAAVAYKSIAATVASLGEDGRSYGRLIGPLVDRLPTIATDVMSPNRSPSRHPLDLGRFVLPGLLPARQLVRLFHGEKAPALLAGAAAHSTQPMTSPMTGAFGLLMTASAHAVGWPVVSGGGQTITTALLAELARQGGSIEMGHWVRSQSDLPGSTVVVFDTSPKAMFDIAGGYPTARAARSYGRFQSGPGVFKMDWALSGPVPWTNDDCRRAGTLHVGGTFAEVAASEAEVKAGRHPERPYCIIVQPSVCDPSRAPAGQHALWGYCHVPNDSAVDMTQQIEAQIERFAPGFSDLVLARVTRTAAEQARHNPNNLGGDIGGGAATLMQTLFRPTVRWNPYRTPLRDLYLCSASTPPGGGVHGMCGYYAARTVLHDRFGGPPPFGQTGHVT